MRAVRGAQGVDPVGLRQLRVDRRQRVQVTGDRADIQRSYEAILTVESRLTATGRNA